MTHAQRVSPRAQQILHKVQRLQDKLLQIESRSATEQTLAVSAPEQANAQADAPEGVSPASEAHQAATELRTLFVDMGLQPHRSDRARQLGDLGADYVLVTFVDEWLIHKIDWRGAQVWPSMLLEHFFFGTQVAGERVFELADDVLNRGSTGRRDLTAALLLVISLGFLGKWRGQPNSEVLTQYRELLYERVTDLAPPEDLQPRRYFSQAEAFTATAKLSAPTRQRALWATGVALGVSLYLGVSYLAWSANVAEVGNLSRLVIQHGASSLTLAGGET